MARAIWYSAADRVELRPEAVPNPTEDEAQMNTHFSAISRGTERLVLNGAVPESEWNDMRAPLQSGTFPFPVKYGYCAAGIVTNGPNELIGRRFFCLHPHQDIFNAPLQMLVPIPDGVSTRRAVLAANMETALNGHWDGGTGPGDRIAVVGAGIVGLMIAAIAVRITGAQVCVIDPNPARSEDVLALGAAFHENATDDFDADVVFHASATSEGLSTAISMAGTEATIVEMSWYGDRMCEVPLGAAFHRKRLRLVSSQVGQVAASRRARWTHRTRLTKALELLADDVFDRFVSDEIAFEDAAEALPAILKHDTAKLAPVIRYAAAN